MPVTKRSRHPFPDEFCAFPNFKEIDRSVDDLDSSVDLIEIRFGGSVCPKTRLIIEVDHPQVEFRSDSESPRFSLIVPVEETDEGDALLSCEDPTVIINIVLFFWKKFPL
jgi:hypothetical protein